MSKIRFAAVLIAAMAATALAQERQATPAESLREGWIGNLNMGVVEPVMQFRNMDVATGEPVVYFDSVTEGRSGLRGTWSRKDTTLIFEIPAIKLTFTGTLPVPSLIVQPYRADRSTRGDRARASASSPEGSPRPSPGRGDSSPRSN